MTSESLREQVEKRIAELNNRKGCAGEYFKFAHEFGIAELEQVLTLIDKMAKELEEERLEAYHMTNRPIPKDPEMLKAFNYFVPVWSGCLVAYVTALDLLIGQPKQIEVNSK